MNSVDPTKKTITKGKLQAFKKTYAKAVKAGRSQFTFEQREYITQYGKHLIEYLETKKLIK